MASITRSFNYDPEENPEIHRYLQSIPDRRGAVGEYIRKALAAGVRVLNGEPVDGEADSGLASLDQVVARLEQIEGLLKQGVSLAPDAQAEKQFTDLSDQVKHTLLSLG
jgi:hypothetical protein